MKYKSKSIFHDVNTLERVIDGDREEISANIFDRFHNNKDYKIIHKKNIDYKMQRNHVSSIFIVDPYIEHWQPTKPCINKTTYLMKKPKEEANYIK